MDNTIEQEIQDKGLTAPRITPADVEANITSEHYFTAGDGVTGAHFALSNSACKYPLSLESLTFCVLVLRNGFTVTGESACASPENFDASLGREIARQNAVAKVWPLMGYELKQRLHGTPTDYIGRMEKELEELTEKLDKLWTYLRTSASDGLSEEQRSDLLQQGIFMAKYHNKLTDRLNKDKEA